MRPGAALALLSCACAFGAPQGAATLTTILPVVSIFEDGGPVSPGQRFVAGETVYFRFGVAQYKTGADGRVEVSGHAQVFDSRGTPIAPEDENVVGATLRDEDKEWKPVLHFQFQIPPLAPPGTYKIRFRVIDAATKQSASDETIFAVSGRDVPASPALVVRNLRFYRAQDDDKPLASPGYRIGDSVWVRFDVTGYKAGDQNAIDVAYDVSVLDAQGTTLFSQPDAAVERSQAYYAQPWVPGIFSLTLNQETRRGSYVVEIAARDGIGGQTATARAEFHVE